MLNQDVLGTMYWVLGIRYWCLSEISANYIKRTEGSLLLTDSGISVKNEDLTPMALDPHGSLKFLDFSDGSATLNLS